MTAPGLSPWPRSFWLAPLSDSYYYYVVTSILRVPVLIVGAGVGGLATSALLAKHGVA
jgi:ribulose 1,5-bisphosphate synthetase/thiazole synthase